MRRIVDDHWHVTFPPYLSPEAKDLVSRLLERRPARRIGVPLPYDALLWPIAWTLACRCSYGILSRSVCDCCLVVLWNLCLLVDTTHVQGC